MHRPNEKRLRRSSAVALAALIALSAGAAEGGDAWAATRPNVVVVMTDDQHPAQMSALEDTRRLLGGSGVTFTRSYATQPLCCPSRASFLTGQYPHNHGVTSNTPPAGGFPAFRDARTLATSLRRSGYTTGYIGKYLNGYTSPESRHYVPPGWSWWRGLAYGGYFEFHLNHDGSLHQYNRYKTDVYTDLAVGFIKRTDPRPFFLYIGNQAPHRSTGAGPSNPSPAPRHEGALEDAPLPGSPAFNEADVSDKPEFIQRLPTLDSEEQATLRERYQDALRSLLAVDDQVERVVAALRRTNQLENTVLVFTTDNGLMYGEHRLRGGKDRIYEEAARVPLLVRGPHFRGGIRRSQLSANIDLAPTVLDLANASADMQVDGRSLVPLAEKPRAGLARQILLETEIGRTGILSRSWLYAAHNSEEELYNLALDPFELTSRHADPEYATTKGGLKADLESLRQCAGASCRR